MVLSTATHPVVQRVTYLDPEIPFLSFLNAYMNQTLCEQVQQNMDFESVIMDERFHRLDRDARPL